jgi:hypothetical protein
MSSETTKPTLYDRLGERNELFAIVESTKGDIVTG